MDKLEITDWSEVHWVFCSRNDFGKFSQIFLVIGLTSSVMLRWMSVLIENFENHQKVQHKSSLWSEILIHQNCQCIRHFTIKMSRFYICVKVSHFVLCLQRLLCTENLLFRGTMFSKHHNLGVKNAIWSQNLQNIRFLIFHFKI